MNADRELPFYVCHKRVQAARIKEIIDTSSDGSARIIPLELDVVSFRTGPGWLPRVRAAFDDPGVYVRYEDGYESWSPTKVFNAGYESEEPPPVRPGQLWQPGDIIAPYPEMIAARRAREKGEL